MAVAIEKRERKRTRREDDYTAPAPSTRAKKGSYDTPETRERKDKVLEWRRQARIAQAENRAEMARDQEYYDGYQWDEEDKAIVESRGQVASVFNLTAITLRWVTGTEKRTRVDYRVMPRHHDDRKVAENKTSLLKYLSDVNKLGFERSRAFADAAIVGLGWLEDGIRNDSEDEPLYARHESWRNMWYDPLSIAPDMSDARFLFREKWVDLDIAELMFPAAKEDLRIAANNIISINQVNREQGNPYLYDDAESIGPSYGSPGDLLGCGTRQRVLLCEAWYRVPEKTKVLRAEGETYHGAVYNPADPVHTWAKDNGLATTHDSIKMCMRLMILCISGKGGIVLQDGATPYWHNRFPFTPIWAYRRGKDNSPYGIVRGLRDPQDDLNKRRSKALYLLNSKQVVADKGAVDDVGVAMEEIARPDGWIEKNVGKELRIEPQSALAVSHVQLMDQDARYIQEVGGVTDENLGRQTNAVSGKAIEARQNQGYTSTSDLFDNLRLAIQLTGERQLSLIEQFYDQPKQLRLTGERKSDMQFISLNTEDGLNPITASQADFVVDEQDFRGTVRQAMFDSMLEMAAKLPPEVGLKLLAIAFEMSDVPMRDEFVKILRDVTGMADPNAEDDPQAMEAKQQQEQMKAEQIAKAQAAQEAAMQLQFRKMEADIALIEGKAKEAVARGDKAQLEALMTKLNALKEALSLAGSAAVAPELTVAADQIMTDVTATPTVNNVAPPIPDNVATPVGARASGGPVERGYTYLGGELGPEPVIYADGSIDVVGAGGPQLFTPAQNGLVIPANAVDGNQVLRQVLAENAGLARVHSTDNTNVIFASPQRIKQAAAYMGGNSGYLEYWPAEEPGDAAKGWMHPSPGKNTLEIFNEELQRDPAKLKQSLYGDLMHGMHKDPEFNSMRNEFMNNFTPEELERIKERKTWWEDVNGGGAFGGPTYDAYIRGPLGADADSSAQGQKELNGTMYSKRQLELLNEMKEYIKTGTRRGGQSQKETVKKNQKTSDAKKESNSSRK